MLATWSDVFFYTFLAASVFGTLYLVAARLAVHRFLRVDTRAGEGFAPPITVLKPLCGDEPRLLENLRSFCTQDYPRYQIVFGVESSSDPAVGVVRRLMRELPDADIALVADAPVRGANRKVGKLCNMMAATRHDLLVVADSDIHVGPDYLSRIVQPLGGADVGLVTCTFAARPTENRWSRLRAMWFNFTFLPSVLLTRMLRLPIGSFGATLALRRGDLERAGGFAAIRDHLADDHALGAAIRRSGKKVVISPYLVDSSIHQPSVGSFMHHELRWGRTLRIVAPAGHTASILTNPVGLAALGLAIPGAIPIFLPVLVAVLLVRWWMVRSMTRALSLTPAPAWMIPVRDILSLAMHVASLFGSRVVWRDRRLQVAPGGRLVTRTRPAQTLF